MKAQWIFTLLVSFLLVNCGSTPPTPRNAEPTVEYFGKKIKHEKPKWTNEARLRQVLDTPGKKYIIFGAEWCEACSFLRRALKEGKLMDNVEFVNIDEEWAAHLARFYGFNVVPTMIEVDEKGMVIAVRQGPGQITLRIIINED